MEANELTKEKSAKAECKPDMKIIEDIKKINSKTAKKILDSREAIHRLLDSDKNLWKREGEE